MADGSGIVSPWGTTSSAYGEDVMADAARSVLVTGRYGGRIDFNPDPKKNGYRTSTNEASDAFVMKLTAGGAFA